VVYIFFDANGKEWNYDSRSGRLYCVQDEDGVEIDGTLQNGEYLYSLELSIQFLMENGYMMPDSRLDGDKISPKEH
jgi:hypothetical protein